MGVYEELGVRRVLNAAGTLTRLGGRLMAPEVAEAMVEASRSNVRMEELQEAAGRYLAQVTGAEAGYVTSGAAAAVSLGIAACMAGLDPVRMERLPRTDGMPDEVIVQRAHRNAYDHAVRAAGARLVEVGWAGRPGVGRNHAWELEAAFTERTAAVYYMAGDTPHALQLPQVCEIAHRHGVPVVVDAAAALPPAENLTRFIAEGADLVAFSGGKAVGGPQASAILVGKRHLIESVALQNQDMDVHPLTWSLRQRYLESGIMPGPPHQGFGRGFKAGKEEIVGLVTALRLFLKQDFGAMARQWQERCEAMAGGLQGLRGVTVSVHASRSGGVPLVHLQMSQESLLSAVALINLLADGDPRICLTETLVDSNVAGINPSCLDPGDDARVVSAVRAALGQAI